MTFSSFFIGATLSFIVLVFLLFNQDRIDLLLLRYRLLKVKILLCLIFGPILIILALIFNKAMGRSFWALLICGVISTIGGIRGIPFLKKKP